MYILKKYHETKNRAILDHFSRLCADNGWKYNMTEGGFVCPDQSAILITSRLPYNGQLLQFSADKTDEFNALVNLAIEQGDFVEVTK